MAIESIIIPAQYISDKSINDISSQEKTVIEDFISKRIAETFLQDIKDTILNQGPGLYGRPWEPLSQMRIQERGTDWPILIDTGRLLESFYIRHVRPGIWTVRTDSNYARLHEYGGTNPQGYWVPERSFMRSTRFKNEQKYRDLVIKILKDLLSE